MIRISSIRAEIGFEGKDLVSLAAKALRVKPEEIVRVVLVKRSVDARDKRDVHYTLQMDVELKRVPVRLPECAKIVEPPAPRVIPEWRGKKRPLVVGMGPAGLFAAYTLSMAGAAPLVIERGRSVDERAADVEAFFAGGPLNPSSNVQFGEGGAGTFSDGKLNTGTKDARQTDVLRIMHEHGAPEEILYAARPHIGTDRLRRMVRNLRETIIRNGAEVRFETALRSLVIEDGRIAGAVIEKGGVSETVQTDSVILAIGHSARDTFKMLRDGGIPMQKKPFSVGVRVEHPQKLIDRSQYGAFAGRKGLGAAEYRLSEHLKNGRGVYTFCMCPGGKVVAAASEAGGVATNGMSLYARDGENANSAVLVGVDPLDFPGDDVLSGVEFQRKWERRAFEIGGGNYRAPAQLMGDYLQGTASTAGGKVEPTYRPGVTYTDMRLCLPNFVSESLKEGFLTFDRRLRGFADRDAVMTGVETRSSSPVRILRGEETLESEIAGLFPCGEGAGYAGGIASAAVDGMRVAEKLLEKEAR